MSVLLVYWVTQSTGEVGRPSLFRGISPVRFVLPWCLTTHFAYGDVSRGTQQKSNSLVLSELDTGKSSV